MNDAVAAIVTDVVDTATEVSDTRRALAWAGKLGQIQQASPRDAVSEAILALIRSGELQPGARLPSEPQLSAMTGVSRSSVREATRRLETMGLVEIRRGKGTYIRSIEAGGWPTARCS